ncbi:hybrid signal transduction histidine kinase M, partial [Tanacetum coccineum]
MVVEDTPPPSSSSSPTVLMASNSSSNKGNKNKPSNLPQICNHFKKGTYKFGDRCKYIHDHQNRSGLNSKNNSIVGIYNMFRSSGMIGYQANFQCHPYWAHTAQPDLYQSRLAHNTSQPTCQPHAIQFGLVHPHQPAQVSYVAQQQQPQLVYTQTPLQPHPDQGLLSPAPAQYGSQATTLPSAFSSMTLQNPTWHMDT